jgi:hypothetical protein
MAGRDHAGCRDAAHGRHHLPEEADGGASDAGGDLFVADRKGAETTMQALAAGAVSIITKPKMG